MRFVPAFLIACIALGAGPARGQTEAEPLPEVGAVAAVAIQDSAAEPSFVTLTTGSLVLVRGQRVVLTQEPGPQAILEEGPPPPFEAVVQPPEAPFPGAVWVPAHWAPQNEGLTWVDGRFVQPKSGHAFVPPRWVSINGHHLFFDGFFVPHRVWVRSFFNTFHFSGDPSQGAAARSRDRGPYWPIGASRPVVGTPSTRGRGPYWPVGLGPPTVLNVRGGTPVGLPSRSRGR